jgi:hypothetical protein
MRNTAIALALCFASGFLAAPLGAAAKTFDHSTVLVKAKKGKFKIKGHKAPKRNTRTVTRHEL